VELFSKLNFTGKTWALRLFNYNLQLLILYIIARDTRYNDTSVYR
jgi:hypothetical protein